MEDEKSEDFVGDLVYLDPKKAIYSDLYVY